MAPGTVRTIPPWIVSRPPQSLAPQHNSSPSDPRRTRPELAEVGETDTPNDSTSRSDEHSASAHRPATSTAAAAVPDGPLSESPDTSGARPVSARAPYIPPSPSLSSISTTPLPPPPAEGRFDLFQRLSTIFRHKEGRKWDYLRSAEPVIVPQYHVATQYHPNEPPPEAAAEAAATPASAPAPSAPSPTAGPSSPVPHGPRDEAGAFMATPAARRGPPPARARPATAPGASSPWWDKADSQWHAFIESTRYPLSPQEKHEIVDDEEMCRLQPGFGAFRRFEPGLDAVANGGHGMGNGNGSGHDRTGWRFGGAGGLPGGGAGADGGRRRAGAAVVAVGGAAAAVGRSAGVGHGNSTDNGHGADAGAAGLWAWAKSKEKRKALTDKALYRRIWQLLLHHPFGPLVCRLTVLLTSLLALAVAIRIFESDHLSHVGDDGSAAGDVASGYCRAPERTQIIVAIVVDVVAVPYIGYITMDDYTGKPLGLRPPKDRIRLILTDLFFIIFKSASTALGFEAMLFFNSNQNQKLMRALGASELIGLISWALTLTINVFREIERLGG